MIGHAVSNVAGIARCVVARSGSCLCDAEAGVACLARFVSLANIVCVVGRLLYSLKLMDPS